MSKAGKKLIESMQEAVAIAQGDPDVIQNTRVTPSYGCIFCDLKLVPSWVHGKPVHHLRKEDRYVECTNPECQSCD